MPKTMIGIMGPGENGEKNINAAFEIGKAIAENGWVLLTGGRSKGVMDAACKGAKSAGGMTIGILATADLSEMSEAVDVPIITGMGSARDNINALSSNVLVAIGMGPGTAAEVALALKAGKKVVLIEAGDEAKSFFQSLAPGHVMIADGVDSAISMIKGLVQ